MAELTSSIQKQVLEIGTRLTSSPSDCLVETAFAWELDHQLHLFETIGYVDLAHTLTAIESGLIPKPEGMELLSFLLELQYRPATFKPTAENGDIYTNREAWLAERTNTVKWLGAGRARREAITAAFVLDVRQRILSLSQAIMTLTGTLIARAEDDKNTPMPDYTYLQAAQPTTFGHYLLGFAFPMLRDLERLGSLLKKVNLSPLGCGSTNGSRLPQGREQLAELLGFPDIVPHARDAMWQADLTIENTAILTSCIINLSRLAEDLQIFSSQEFSLIELDDQHARASKIMPQKKNPFALTHIRGVANKIIGLTTSICASARTPSGQPDNRLMIYGELPEGMRLVEQAVALMSETLQRLHFNSDKAYTLIQSGWTLATDLTEALVQYCGLDFRSAHQLVASLVRSYPSYNTSAIDADVVMRMSEQVLGKKIVLTDAQLKSALTPEDAIQQRKEAGGSSQTSMDEMLADCHQQLIIFHDQLLAEKTFLETKTHNLLQHIKRYTSA